MADNTIIQQGRFTSDGTDEEISIRSDVDWMEVINETQWATTQATGRGVKFEWQRGLADGHGFEYTKADTTNVLQGEKITTGGFTRIVGTAGFQAPVTGTTITKADPPVCTATAHGYSNGDVVDLSNLTEMPQLAGEFFTIGSVTTNTFVLTHMDTNTANFTAETAFTVRKIVGFPVWNVTGGAITSITQASSALVQFAAEGTGFAVDQVIRFQVPSEFGMVEMDGLQGTITAFNSTTNTATVNIDSSSFTAFVFPAASAVPFSLAQCRSIGTVSTSVADASTENLKDLIMLLGAGIDGPAGSTSDVIYWKAGKSFSVSNE